MPWVKIYFHSYTVGWHKFKTQNTLHFTFYDCISGAVPVDMAESFIETPHALKTQVITSPPPPDSPLCSSVKDTMQRVFSVTGERENWSVNSVIMAEKSLYWFLSDSQMERSVTQRRWLCWIWGGGFIVNTKRRLVFLCPCERVLHVEKARRACGECWEA